MIELVALSLAAVAATASTIGLAIAFLNHRERVQSESPKIRTNNTFEDNAHVLHFRVEPRFRMPASNITPGGSSETYDWEITGIKVAGYRRYKYLSQISPAREGLTQWTNSISYEGPVIRGRIQIHPDCSKAQFLFICRKSSLRRSIKIKYRRASI